MSTMSRQSHSNSNKIQSFSIIIIFIWIRWVLQWSLPSLHHTWCHLEPGFWLGWHLCRCHWTYCPCSQWCTATFHRLHFYKQGQCFCLSMDGEHCIVWNVSSVVIFVCFKYHLLIISCIISLLWGVWMIAVSCSLLCIWKIASPWP